MVGSAARVIVLASVLAGAAAAPMCARSQVAPGPRGDAPRAASVPPSTPASTSAPTSAPTAGLSPADSAGEPRVSRQVAEDEHVRIEELRVRGESRQITVQPKLGGSRPYEIAPSSGALDPSQRGRRAPGTSQWRVLSF